MDDYNCRYKLISFISGRKRKKKLSKIYLQQLCIGAVIRFIRMDRQGLRHRKTKNRNVFIFIYVFLWNIFGMTVFWSNLYTFQQHDVFVFFVVVIFDCQNSKYKKIEKSILKQYIYSAKKGGKTVLYFQILTKTCIIL